jgi:hypothetical protein
VGGLTVGLDIAKTVKTQSEYKTAGAIFVENFQKLYNVTDTNIALEDIGEAMRSFSDYRFKGKVPQDSTERGLYDACQKVIKSAEKGDVDLGAIGEFSARMLLHEESDGLLKRFNTCAIDVIQPSDILQSNATETGSDNKYHIVTLDNGNMYVQASRNVLSGNDVSTWRKEITGFFNELLDGQESIDIKTVEGDVLTISKSETANKARDNYRQEKGKRVKLSDEEFNLKLNAEAHIDELAEISKPINNSATTDTKNHNFAKDGFSYRTAYFEDFDGQYYKITMSVGHNGETATVYNVGRIKKDSLPSAAKITAVVGSKALGKLSTNSIPENDGNVNSNDDVAFHEPDKRDMPKRDSEGDYRFKSSGNSEMDSKMRHIYRLGKRLKVEVRFDDKVKTGKYNLKNKVIYLNPNLPTAQMYSIIFKHEFVHSLETRKKYSAFKDFCFDKSDNFLDWCRQTLILNGRSTDGSRKEVVTRVRELYTEMYKASDEVDAYEKEHINDYTMETEMLAQFVGEYMFRGEQDSSDLTPLDRMVDELTHHKGIVRTILDFISGIKEKIKDGRENRQLRRDMRALERKFKAAYNSKVVENKNSTNEQVEKYSLIPYTEHQKENWKNSKRIVIYKNSSQLEEFIIKSLKGEIENKKMYFGSVSDELAERIYFDTKVDVKGYNVSLSSFEIRKINNDHGDEYRENLRGQRAVKPEDYESVLNTILNPNEIELSDKKYNGKPVLNFKANRNEHFTVCAIVSDKHLDLYIQTVYIGKNNGNIATPTTEQAVVNTPEAGSSIVSNDSVPQSNTSSQDYSMQKTQKNSENTENVSENTENVTEVEEKSAISELIKQDLYEYQIGNITEDEFMERTAKNINRDKKEYTKELRGVLKKTDEVRKVQKKEISKYKKDLSTSL